VKLIDEKGKLFGIVNIIDLAVVLVLVAGGLGAYHRFAGGMPQATVPVVMTLWVEGVRQPTVDALVKGDVVHELTTNGTLGTLTVKEVKPHVKEAPTDAGKFVLSEIPGKFDLSLTVEGSAIESGGGLIVGGKDWRVGNNLTIKTNKAAVNAIFVKIEPKGQ
jgi:hypothetical protein